jgi:hypothetical protein
LGWMKEPNDVGGAAEGNIDSDLESGLITMRSEVRDAVVVQCAVTRSIKNDIHCEWSDAGCAEIPRYSRVVAAMLEAATMPSEWRMNMAKR